MWNYLLNLFLILCFTAQEGESDPGKVLKYQCRKGGINTDDAPTIANAYSVNMRINYLEKLKTVRARQVVNLNQNKIAIDMWSDNQHVKYIMRGDEHIKMVITDAPNERPKCAVKSLSYVTDVLDKNTKKMIGSGPYDILNKLNKVLWSKKQFFYTGELGTENGVQTERWETCSGEPRINVSLWTIEEKWRVLSNDLTKIEAEINDATVSILLTDYDPSKPKDSEFQPAEDVFCEGYRDHMKPPPFTDYFYYQSEIIVYENGIALPPLISYRTVYYDYNGRVMRTDFQDAVEESKALTTQLTTVVHDFNSGVQYSFNPITGACKVDRFQATFGAISATETVNNAMLNPKQFFSMEGIKLSQHGQFPTRGLESDAFIGEVNTKKGANLYRWYFSSNRTRFVENDHLEKNVLLKMVSSPKADANRVGEVEVNFYNFVRAEPAISIYDISSCYNGSVSTALILTFPFVKVLRDHEKLLKNTLQHVLRDVMGVSRLRVFVKEITFEHPYIHADFKVLDRPPLREDGPAEPSLTEAIDMLNASVSSDKFSVTVDTGKDVFLLNVEPNGLNHFSDSRPRLSKQKYKESSVIGLTVGMLFLGFVLGAVVINLAVSRKYGVSLFQNQLGREALQNQFGESSM